MKRNELIEKAAKAIRLAYAKEMYTGMGFEGAAEAALAVYEEANVPTDDEREAEAKRIWPVDREYSPSQTTAVFSVRELDAYCVSAFTRGAKWAAGFHRTVQGEPKHDESCGERCNHCSVCGEGLLYGSRCPAHYLNQEPGEPTEIECPNCGGDGATYEQVRVGQHATPFVCARCDGDGTVPGVQGEPSDARIHMAIAYIRASWLGTGEPVRNTPAGEIIAILRGERSFDAAAATEGGDR